MVQLIQHRVWQFKNTFMWSPLRLKWYSSVFGDKHWALILKTNTPSASVAIYDSDHVNLK